MGYKLKITLLYQLGLLHRQFGILINLPWLLFLIESEEPSTGNLCFGFSDNNKKLNLETRLQTKF